MKQEFYYPSRDGKTQIHAIEWIPEGEMKGVLQICHGMVEYINRYDEIAEFMAGHGYNVTGHDYMLGHSMGSFLLREYLTMYGTGLAGAIIMGTGYQGALVLNAGQLICRVLAAFKGWKYRSKFVDNLSFGSYNKKFEPAETTKDWITSYK